MDSQLEHLLNTCDSFEDNSYRSFCGRISVPQLFRALYKCAVSHVFGVKNHFLLDTEAPKHICSTDWLEKRQWKSIATFSVPKNFKLLRFELQKVKALRFVYLIAKLYDYSGKSHYLRQVVFVLLTTPIPFLIGLETIRNATPDVIIKEGSRRHLFIARWKVYFPLSVLSHLWITFGPVHTEIDSFFDCQ